MEQPTLPPGPPVGKSIIDVLTAPGDIFQSLKGTASSPKLWVVPLITSLLVAVGVTIAIMTDATLHGQILDQQRAQFEKMVDQGKLSRDEAERRIDGMERMGVGIFIAIGSIAAIIFISAAFFLGALVLWLVDKTILKCPLGYDKHLELFGIAGWIGVFGGIVTVLMMIGLGSMGGTPSAALAVLGNYDPANNTHKFLSALNVFSIWQTAVVGIGLGKLSGKSTVTGLAVAFVLWLIWVGISVSLGLVR